MQEDITVSAKGALIEKARARAVAWGTTLEDELRRWLESYASEETEARAVVRAAVGDDGEAPAYERVTPAAAITGQN